MTFNALYYRKIPGVAILLFVYPRPISWILPYQTTFVTPPKIKSSSDVANIDFYFFSPNGNVSFSREGFWF